MNTRSQLTTMSIWLPSGKCGSAPMMNENNLVLLTIGTGIGAGIIINGAVYGGSHNLAGKLVIFCRIALVWGKNIPVLVPWNCWPPGLELQIEPGKP